MYTQYRFIETDIAICFEAAPNKYLNNGAYLQ